MRFSGFFCGCSALSHGQNQPVVLLFIQFGEENDCKFYCYLLLQIIQEKHARGMKARLTDSLVKNIVRTMGDEFIPDKNARALGRQHFAIRPRQRTFTRKVAILLRPNLHSEKG